MVNSGKDDFDHEPPKALQEKARQKRTSLGGGHGESAGDGAGRVSLSEASQAVEDVLAGCRQELRLLRHWLQGGRGDLN
jgi:hypothetical protein